MEVSWPSSCSGRYRGHRLKLGVAKERPRRIGSRRQLGKEQRHSGSYCRYHNHHDHDHHRQHRRCRFSFSTKFVRAVSVIAVSLVLLFSTGTASTVATAAAASAATAIHATTSPSAAAAADADAADAPAGQHHAISVTAAFETKTDSAVASSAEVEPITTSSAELGPITALETDPAESSAELGPSRASRKPPPLLCPWDRFPAAAFLLHAVDDRDDERGESATLAAACASAGDGSVEDGGGGENVGVGDGSVDSSPNSWRNAEQQIDTVDQEIGKVRHEYDSVGQEEAQTTASASDPPISTRDNAPPSAAAATDGSKREVVVNAKQAPSPASLPTGEDANAGTPLAEALTNRKEQELNVGAVNSAVYRDRAGESAEESVDVGETINRGGGAVPAGGEWGWGGGEGGTVAAAPSKKIIGGGVPTTITDADAVTDAVTVSVSARRGSGRTPLAKTGGCGSKGPSPALGSWAEEQDDDEEEGGLPPSQEKDGGELGRPQADRDAHGATADADTGASALGNGPTVSDVTLDFAEPPGERIGPTRHRDGRDLDEDRRRLVAETSGLPRKSVASEGQEEAVSVGGKGGNALDTRAAVNGDGEDNMLEVAGSAVPKPDVPAAECATAEENGEGSKSARGEACGTGGGARQSAEQSLSFELGAVEGGARDNPVKSDDLSSTLSGREAKEDVDGFSTQSGRHARENVVVRADPGFDDQGAVGAASAAANLELEFAQQSNVPEMSPTLSARTDFHGSERPRAEGGQTDVEETAGAAAGGKGEDGGTQQTTTKDDRRWVKGGGGWSAPGWGKRKKGFEGSGGGGGGRGGSETEWLKGNKVVGALAVLLGGFMMLAQGTLPRWFPIFGGDYRDGWALDLPPPGSRRGSLLSGMGSDNLGGSRFDEPPMPDLVSDDEPEMESPVTRAAANGAQDEGDLGTPLKWDTRPKGPDHLVFHHILGVVPTGVLNAWKDTNRSRGEGGCGGGGIGGVVGECAAPGRAVQGSEASVGRGGGGDGNDSVNGAPSTRRGASSSSSACTAGSPRVLGWKTGKRQPLPPVRYTPEWHAWCAARGGASDRAEGRAEDQSEERSEEAQLQVFQLYEASCVTASEDRKVAAGDGVGVRLGVEVEMGVEAAVLDVEKAAPQPQSKSTTPVAICLQRKTPTESCSVDQAEGRSDNGGGDGVAGIGRGGNGGGGGDDGDGNFTDGLSVLSATASAHPPAMVSRVA